MRKQPAEGEPGFIKGPKPEVEFHGVRPEEYNPMETGSTVAVPEFKPAPVEPYELPQSQTSREAERGLQQPKLDKDKLNEIIGNARLQNGEFNPSKLEDLMVQVTQEGDETPAEERPEA